MFIFARLFMESTIMPTATRQTITLSYDPRSAYAQSFLQTMKMSKLFKVEFEDDKEEASHYMSLAEAMKTSISIDEMNHRLTGLINDFYDAKENARAY